MRLLDKLPLTTALILAATLGLAPFMPEPHVWQKLGMLGAGDLVAPLDMFDLVFHGAPWVLLAAKLGRLAQVRLAR